MINLIIPNLYSQNSVIQREKGGQNYSTFRAHLPCTQVTWFLYLTHIMIPQISSGVIAEQKSRRKP